MKRIIASLLILITLISFGGCAKNNKKTEKKESTDIQAKPLEIDVNDIVLGENMGRKLFLYDDFFQYITIGQYKNIEYNKAETTLTDEEVIGHINEMLVSSGLTQQKPVTDRAVQDGDIVNIDFVGKKDGVAFEGGTAQGQDLEIGSDTFIDGFESGLIGGAIGETKILNLTFPENYSNTELAGAAVVFEVKINSISEKVAADLTDELVTSATGSEYTNVADFKAYMKNELEAQLVEEKVLTPAFKNCTYNTLPQTELDYFYSFSLDVYVNQGMSAEDEAVKQASTEASEHYVKYYLMYFAIAQSEGITITEDEFKLKIKEFIEQKGFESLEAGLADIDFDAFYISLIYEKVANVIIGSAVGK